MDIPKDYAFIQKKINKKERKLLLRNTLYEQLKSIAPYPELVEIEDIKCEDPIFYNKIKSIYKSVPVCQRWKNKHLFPINYKPKEYTIPTTIVNTGLELLRCNILQIKKTQTDKQKFMEKLFPKLGKASINPKSLYNAFTDYKPFTFSYGEPFDFTWETERKRYVPGMLTDELKIALGMTEFSPPPWIFKMQKIGPPPSYPNIKIPGVNADIPPGCQYGYEPNKWGRPCFIPEDKEEYIYNLENQYTSLCKININKNHENINKVDTEQFKDLINTKKNICNDNTIIINNSVTTNNCTSNSTINNNSILNNCNTTIYNNIIENSTGINNNYNNSNNIIDNSTSINNNNINNNKDDNNSNNNIKNSSNNNSVKKNTKKTKKLKSKLRSNI